MARLNVNPTRMELTRLKKRLATATRGHKLLKDKRDELMKQFLDIVRTSEELRQKVEQALMESYAGFQAAGAVMSPEMLEQTFLSPKQSEGIQMDFRNIMSVNVPLYGITTKTDDKADIYPYGFANTSVYVDENSGALPSLKVRGGVEETADLRYEGEFRYLSTEKADLSKVEKKLELPEEWKAPGQKGQEIGRAVYYLDGKELGSVGIVLAQDVKKAGFLDYLKKIWDSYRKI